MANPRHAPPAKPESTETHNAARTHAGAGLLESLVAHAQAAPPGAAPVGQILSGHLTRLDDEGCVWFHPEGASEEFPVTIGLEVSDGVLVRAVRNRRRALALSTADTPPRWVLIGLVRERVSAAARDARKGELEVKIDGETLRFDAEDKIELRCGKSSLLLRADGRVELSGVYVVHKSRGPMKVKGATIALN